MSPNCQKVLYVFAKGRQFEAPHSDEAIPAGGLTKSINIDIRKMK
jgi:hypothetical protein